MKVTVAVFGRFHAFYLAHQLHRRGHLERLITSYPKFEVGKYGIPRDRVASLLLYELLNRGWHNWWPSWLRPDRDVVTPLSNAFDRAAARSIPPGTDLYVGWSGLAEKGILRARELGAAAVVERGSSHIEYQREILQEEYERYRVKGVLPPLEIVEKEKREYELADYISIPSEFVRRSFLAKGVSGEKLVKIPYGVDLSGFRQVPRQDDVFRVIFAGGMTLRKGVHYLLQAFAELKLPGAELWLIGSATPEIELFFARYEGSFRHLGHIPQAQLFEHYSQCDVFAICSIEEGMALVQPQAMACGLPLICTTNTGGDDLIEEGKEGFTIPIRDVEALKEKILWCFENREACREMGQAAKRKVAHGFSWDDYGERIEKAYEDVCRVKRGNG